MQLQATAVPAAGHHFRTAMMAARVAGWVLLAITALVQFLTGEFQPWLLIAGTLVAVVVPMVLLNLGTRR
ncbi:hypothetical protein [Actinoplanes palleronii]|nr:hypothetical protein [Actinoplanes palleronii]